MKAPVSKTLIRLALFSIFGERKHSYLFLLPGGLGTAEKQLKRLRVMSLPIITNGQMKVNKKNRTGFQQFHVTK